MTLSTLRVSKNWYENEITKALEKINEYERECESLDRFKGAVEIAQSEYHAIHSGKTSALESVVSIKTNSRTAQKYYDGMDAIFRVQGNNEVARVYTFLLSGITQKRADYLDKIYDEEENIARYQRKIKELEAKIREEQEKEALGQSGGQ